MRVMPQHHAVPGEYPESGASIRHDPSGVCRAARHTHSRDRHEELNVIIGGAVILLIIVIYALTHRDY